MTNQFFVRVVQAYQRQEQRKVERKKLAAHLEKVPSSKKLEGQIEKVIALERGKDISGEVQHHIKRLEKKFDTYTNAVHERKAKIKEIEEKVKKKVPAEEIRQEAPTMKAVPAETPKKAIVEDPTIALKNKLYDIEETYYELKKQGIPAAQLKKLKRLLRN